MGGVCVLNSVSMGGQCHMAAQNQGTSRWASEQGFNWQTTSVSLGSNKGRENKMPPCAPRPTTLGLGC